MLKEYIQIFKIISKSEEKVKSLKAMELDFKNTDEGVKKAWFDYKQIVGNELLSKMPIKHLNDVETGMPIETLINNGLNYVGDCSYKSQEYFEQFSGIGNVKSRRIVVAVEALMRATFDELDFKIKGNRQSEELLKALYKHMQYKHNEKEIIQFENNRNKLIQGTKKSLSLARKRKHILPWLFTKDKVLINGAIEELLALDTEALVSQYQSLADLNKPISLHDDFNKNSASYYAVLEKSLNIKLDFNKTYLSKALIEKVKGTKLNMDQLDVSPRAYQYFGAQYIISQEKTLIGDEMGLGKTIEALVAINHLFQENRGKYFVVIAPLSLLTNWKRETEKWTKIKAYVFHGNNRMEAFSLWLESGGILITTFGHASLLDLDQQIQIDMLVVDEAHYVKNPKAQRSKAVYAIGEKADYITYMSGTPLENKVEEMVQLISVLQKPVADTINNNFPEFSIRPKTFRETISPVYLRRNRQEVLRELPDLEEVEYWVPFGITEIDHYKEGIQEGNFMKMRRSAWVGGSISESPKLNALVDICNQAKNEGHKIIIFSFFKDVINVIDKTLKDRSYSPICGMIEITSYKHI